MYGLLGITILGHEWADSPMISQVMTTWLHHQWKYFPCYWPFGRGIHQSPVNSPHKGQWYGALMFSLICAWTNSWANNGDTGDFRHHHTHNDVIVMIHNDFTVISENHWQITPSVTNKSLFTVAIHYFIFYMLFHALNWHESNQLKQTLTAHFTILLPRMPYSNLVLWCHINGLVQERRNASALAMELRLSCTNPSAWTQGTGSGTSS